MNVRHCVITPYFGKNDLLLGFKHNSNNNNHIKYKEENENTKITLNGVYKMITFGNALLLEKVIMFCRFHKGLDSLMFVDKFYFQV